MKRITVLLALCLIFSGLVQSQTTAPASFGPTPNSRQMKYLRSPMAAFIHFGMNTFAGSDGIEWGNDVKRPASTFNPTKGKVDTDQWVRLLKKAGFTRVIITLKHHDGFCTWPTKITDYNISKSPYMSGNGDLAKELSESCDKYGLDMGIYLSPWDAWEPTYGDSTPGDYNDFYDGQLRELLGGAYGRLNTETGSMLKHEGGTITQAEKERFGQSKMIRYVSGIDQMIYPIAFIKNKIPMAKRSIVCSYTKEGRAPIHTELNLNQYVLKGLREKISVGHSTEYHDSKISLFSAQKGKCAISGEEFADAEHVAVWLKVPRALGGFERYKNMVLIHKKYLIL